MRKKRLEKFQMMGYQNARWKRAFKSTKTRIGFAIAAIFIFCAVFAPILAPHDPLSVDITVKLQGPSLTYPLGTDQLGRCILSRLLWGSRYSLSYTFCVLVITILIGVPIGLFSGYVGGKTDTIIIRIIDIFMAMPAFIVALAIAGTRGASGENLVLAMSIAFWAEYARVSRALTLQVKEQNYILALKAGGCNNLQIIFKHVLRNIAPSIISLATIEVGGVILAIAGFSFIGLGVQAPTPEWGIMLSESKSYIQTYPRLMFIPGIVVMIVVFAFNLLGEGIQNGMSAE